MLCVGLTGNIASGKSTALAYFQQQGIYTISADTIARELTSQPETLQKIQAFFGDTILNDTGELNRPMMRKIITADAVKRRWLENYLHPRIQQTIKERILKATSPYIVIEIPLLLDKKNYPFIHRILLITTPMQQQIQRIIARDHCSIADAKAIINIQPTAHSRKKIADNIIRNNQDNAYFVNQLATLHNSYLILSKKYNFELIFP